MSDNVGREFLEVFLSGKVILSLFGDLKIFDFVVVGKEVFDKDEFKE